MKKILLFLGAFILSIPSLFAYHVDMYIMDGTDGQIDEPWQYVSIENQTTDQFAVLNSNFLKYDYDNDCVLKIYPGDLDYEIRVSVEAAGDIDMKFEYGEYFLTLDDAISGGEVTITVYPAGEAPAEGSGIEEVTASFIVTAASSTVTNPESLVDISYWDRTAMEKVTVNGSATVGSGTTFDLVPSKGYMLTVTSFNNEGTASISDPSNIEGEWNISISESPADDFVSFFVEVAEAPKSIWLNFASKSENINGNPQDFVTVTGLDEPKNNENQYYFTDNKNLVFTLMPDAEFTISSIDITLDGENVGDDLADYKSVVKMDENGFWTFNISPDASGMVFTVNLEDTEESKEDITVNFTLAGFEKAYELVAVTNNTTHMDITPTDSNTFSVTVSPEDEEGVIIEVVANPGYMFDYEKTSVVGATVRLKPESKRILYVEIPYTLMNNNGEVTLTLTEAVEGEDIPVHINVGNNPGLVSGLNWAGIETIITNDTQLENYVVNMPGEEFESDLLIAYAQDEEGNLIYIVTDILATYINPNASQEDTLTCKVEKFDDNCIVTIPETATAVYISFVAVLNTETGINGINTVNNDAVIYNLQGVRVNANNLGNGMYIVNGKKVMVKK